LRDFTPEAYRALLSALKEGGYGFQTVADFLQNPGEKTVILRHDVDRLPRNALRLARLEADLYILATYYFRTVPAVFDPGIIREIAGMGHEIGYHYENLSSLGKKQTWETGDRRQGSTLRRQETGKEITTSSRHTSDQKSGDRRQETGEGKQSHTPYPSPLTPHRQIYAEAIEDFENNLNRLREICPVQTVCMHGSPLSPWDNRELWNHTDYRQYGIIGEPYLDIDFVSVLYLTDTGRRWDGEKVNVRDKVPNSGDRRQETGDRRQEVKLGRQETGDRRQGSTLGRQETGDGRQEAGDYSWETGDRRQETGIVLPTSFRRTGDIIRAVRKGDLPYQVMINTHPQRWEERIFPWLWEGGSQSIKNLIKRIVIRRQETGKGITTSSRHTSDKKTGDRKKIQR